MREMDGRFFGKGKRHASRRWGDGSGHGGQEVQQTESGKSEDGRMDESMVEGEEEELWPGQFEARVLSRQRQAAEEKSKGSIFFPPLGSQFTELRRNKEQQQRDEIAREQQRARRDEILDRDRKAAKGKRETPSVRARRQVERLLGIDNADDPAPPSAAQRINAEIKRAGDQKRERREEASQRAAALLVEQATVLGNDALARDAQETAAAEKRARHEKRERIRARKAVKKREEQTRRLCGV